MSEGDLVPLPLVPEVAVTDLLIFSPEAVGAMEYVVRDCGYEYTMIGDRFDFEDWAAEIVDMLDDPAVVSFTIRIRH